MGLPWVRLDSDIANHDKIVRLLGQRDGHKAFTLYICSLGWSGGAGTDGHIPRHMLGRLYGQQRLAELLVDTRLWEYAEDGDGWVIRNWAQRQELSAISAGKRAAAELGGKKGNCVRWHGPDCGCWRESA
jgi:hypothetical protein